MKKTMLALRKTPGGEEYYEVSNQQGALLATKNHQGGLDDQYDESNDIERPGSKRCPVKLISKYIRHLNPESSNLFQRPRSPCKSFNPAKDELWFCLVQWAIIRLKTCSTVWPQEQEYSRIWRITRSGQPPSGGFISSKLRGSTHDKGDNLSPKRREYWELQQHYYIPPIQSNVIRDCWLCGFRLLFGRSISFSCGWEHWNYSCVILHPFKIGTSRWKQR